MCVCCVMWMQIDVRINSVKGNEERKKRIQNYQVNDINLNNFYEILDILK